jgi:hypothetical protein
MFLKFKFKFLNLYVGGLLRARRDLNLHFGAKQIKRANKVNHQDRPTGRDAEADDNVARPQLSSNKTLLDVLATV